MIDIDEGEDSKPLTGNALIEAARRTRFVLRHCGRPLREKGRGIRQTWREVANSIIDQARVAAALRKEFRRCGATENHRKGLEQMEQHINKLCDSADGYAWGESRRQRRKRRR